MFEESYGAIMIHLRDTHGFIYKNVNMNTGILLTSWIDSLAAFFPGLQVLIGDIDNAIKHHWFYFTIWKKYKAIPERFDFSAKAPSINSYPLRPEFIESTYMLYQATKNPIYLEIGEMVLNDIEKYSRTKCGYSGIDDVLKKSRIDRMESFFVSETLKYLYLLFDTEGHLLPVNKIAAIPFKQSPHTSPVHHSPSECHLTPPKSPLTSRDSLDFPLPLQHIRAVNWLVGLEEDPDTDTRLARLGGPVAVTSSWRVQSEFEDLEFDVKYGGHVVTVVAGMAMYTLARVVAFVVGFWEARKLNA
ncbi:ER degradation-enhancing alpha-mannosidase-like protein 1 [Nowakowskiella sp. JEL0078]|nr:ER degradation-enhancing alpha-mannosidase-like protein 1 [Nowakowskiella sp. JEL0078]